MFSKLKKKLQGFVEEEKTELTPKVSLETQIKKKVTRKAQIKEKDIDKLLENLEISLLSVDVSLDLIEKLKENIKQELIGRKVKASEDLAEVTWKAIRETVNEELREPEKYLDEEVQEKEEPYVVMFVGPNGHGKTTTIAKISYLLQQKGMKTVLAAADTFRAASIEQLGKWAEKLDTKLIKHDYGADPAAVCYDAKKHAQSKGKQAVLIDTAGRSELDKNLMNQLEKIKKVVDPDYTVYVTEAVAGNAAVRQADEFNRKIGIDGFILTKTDTDAKGGCLLSISSKVKKPIQYIGTGQELKDLKKFKKQWFLGKILPKSDEDA